MEMLNKYIPISADLIFTRNPSWLGKAIRFCQRHTGEPECYTNHIAGISHDNDGSPLVVEALWTVKATPWDEWGEYAYQAWRYVPLTMDERLTIGTRAWAYYNRKYGWWKLGVHLIDSALGKMFCRNVYLARRMLKVDEYPICSWCWAYAYDSIGYRFGCSPNAADPDTMHDWVMSTSGWEMVQTQAGV